MIIKFDEAVFSTTLRTEVKDENDKLLCWGIYDFSYKHRRRTFVGDDEIFYCQLKIETDDDEVIVCDGKDNLFFNVKNNKCASNGWTLDGDIYNWNFEVVDNDGNKVMSSKEKYGLDTYDTDVFECIKFVYAFARFEK